jgi:hypothetical protein
MRIKDTVTVEEDLKFSDETVEDVVPGKNAVVREKHDVV